MTWSKEHEVVIDATSTYVERRDKLFSDVLTYHYETFLPAHGVTTRVNSYRGSTSTYFKYLTWDCRRTITPTGRPNLASYEKTWMDSFRFYKDSKSTDYQHTFT